MEDCVLLVQTTPGINYDPQVYDLNFLAFSDHESGNGSAHRLAWCGMTDLLRLALEQKCEVDLRNVLARTPLHLASEANHCGAVRELLA